MVNPTVSRIIENQIANINGYPFQNFCERMLSVMYPDFRTIIPQGSKGDGKNDGFCIDDKRFFQCYGTKGIDSKALIKKMRNDFKGCLSKNIDVEEFIFISNHPINFDKNLLIENLRKSNNVKIDYWGPSEIYGKIHQFQDHEIDFVLGYSLSEACSDFRKRPIFYSEEEQSVKKIPLKEMRRKTLIAFLALVGWVGLMIVSFKLFITGYFLDINNPLLSTFWMVILMSPLAIFIFYIKYVILYLLPISNRERYFINGIFHSRPDKQFGFEYTLAAKCIYPNCREGIVRVSSAPEMEKHKFNRHLIGRCSRDRDEHTYTFDANRTGIFKEFDHSPIEQKNNLNRYYY